MANAPVRDTGYPGLKDEQDEQEENRDFITNYLLPITYYQPQLDN